jgi:hypothetical protein
MKRLALAASALFVIALPISASAAPSITWLAGSGAGSDALPCGGAEHWVLSEAMDVTSASLLVGGVSYAMQPDDGNAWSVDTDAPIVLGDVAVATYEGDGAPTLGLSSCTAASSPSPTPSPSPTDPPGGVPVRGAGSGAQGGGGSALTGSTGSTGSTTTPRTAAGPGRAANPPFAPNGTGGATPRDPASQPTRAGDPPPGSGDTPYVTGALEPVGVGSATSGLPDTRKPPLLLVIAVLGIIASSLVVAAKRKLWHPSV